MQRSILRTLARNKILSRREVFSSLRFLSSSASTEEKVQNAFEILGIPERFTIDENEMKNKYRALMTKYHPDRNRHGTPDEQDDMQQKSSAVTQAYEQLSARHTRAAHLMALRGKPMNETLSQSVVGMDFLMQIMEVRESIDEVASSGGDESLRPLLEENERRMAETCSEFEDAMEKGDLDRALQQTARLQYWNRVGETIREKMESFD